MRRLFLSGRPSPDASRSAPSGISQPDPVPLPGPADARTDRQWSLDELADAYAYPAPEERTSGGRTGAGVWLRANMVASLDGATHHGGRSQPLSSEADMRIFGVLRALADVVVVGAETVRQEGYGPARRREHFAARRAAAGQPPAPAIAVVSASLDLDFSLPLFTEPLTPTLVVTGECAPPDRVEQARRAGAEVLFAGEGAVADPARVPGVLAGRGLLRQLTEGGPTLLGGLAAAGALDELCLALAPRVSLGQAGRIMRGPDLDVPEDFELEGVLEEAGFLFTRYRRGRQRAE